MVHLILEIVIFFATIGSWVLMFRRGGDRVLSQRGLASLKYYTCLSNIFAGLVSGMTVFCLIVTGMRALSLEVGIQDAYYWISIAADATGNSMMKERYDQMARDELPEEEYQKVQHLLEIRTHTTE